MESAFAHKKPSASEKKVRPVLKATTMNQLESIKERAKLTGKTVQVHTLGNNNETENIEDGIAFEVDLEGLFARIDQKIDEQAQACQQKIDERTQAFQQKIDEQAQAFQQKIDEHTQAFQQKIDEQAQAFQKKNDEHTQAFQQEIDEQAQAFQKKNDEKYEAFDKKYGAQHEQAMALMNRQSQIYRQQHDRLFSLIDDKDPAIYQLERRFSH